jgi:hypothetical protein
MRYDKSAAAIEEAGMDRIRFITVGMTVALLVAAIPTLAQHAQAATASRPNRLLTGKLMYVGPMPHGLDAWLIQDLKDWGKYKPTQEQEGSDLVVKADWHRRRMVFVMRHGVPVPRQERRPEGKKKPILATISIHDWVTGAQLWRADILDQKPKNRNRNAAPGPEIEIRARGLSSAQLAETLVRRLRAYVTQLERRGGPSAALPPRPQQ